MMPSKILENSTNCEIQAAMGMALLRFKNGQVASGHHMTLDDIGRVMGKTGAAVSLYIIDTSQMSAISWLKATEKWPELNGLMMDELDQAEKDVAAPQRAFKLESAA